MHVLGIIPARGGSKGIPGKNLAIAGGRSLLAWTADAARGSRALTRTILSTDDDAIAQAGRDLGIEVPFMRDAALAQDDTLIGPVLVDLLGRLARDEAYVPEIIVLLQPTSPLRRAEHIDRAVALLIDSGADTVVSVVEVPHQFSPASLMTEEDGRLVAWGGGPMLTRRQDKPRVYARNGPAVLACRPRVLDAGGFYSGVTRPLVMRPEESVDVDSPWDLELADWLLTRRA